MELCEACRSPLPALGRREGFLSNGARRGRRKHSRFIAIQVPPTDLLISQINKSSVWKSQIVSLQRGDSARTSGGLCKVLWSIEADVAEGQLMYVTGDLVALGCWDSDMAVLMAPCKENANLWKAEVKIPSGLHFKYNYFVRDGGQSASNPVWRPGPVFSLSVPLIRKKGEHITVRDLWVVSPIEAPPFSLWCSLLDVIDYSSFPAVERSTASSRGKYKRVPKSEKDELETKISSGDANSIDVAVINDIELSTNGSGQVIREKDQPVEEPWLFISNSVSATDVSFVNDVHGPEKEATEVHQGLENIDRKGSEELSLVRMEDPVSTIILINSSVCTMQRIAILEDDKLVELLLEPVKNNVQCDSVYLGVVTKLVPHMGGAFVDIGISRPSLMDIKRSRDPFTYPPFVRLPIGHEFNGSIMTEQKGQMNVHDSEIDTYAGDSVNDVIMDDSVQYIHEDLDEHDVEDAVNDSVSYRSNVADGNVDYNGDEADSEFYDEEIGHIMEREADESHTSDAQSSNGMKEKDILSQDSTEAIEGHSDENKWSHVRKGTKIIVQVVKEGLGTKGPALTAYPNLRSRFWILIAQCNRIGVSKKITGVERTRLRVIAKTLQPPGFGLTVRTVAAGHSLEELQKDLEGLLSTWKGIVEHAKSAALAADEGVEGAVPAILHRAMGQTLSVVQDYFNDKVKFMVVDSPRTYHEVTSYLQEIAPDLCDRVILYSKKTPIFDEYGIEEEINNILSKRVSLSNGGSLVIEQTEALVSIDVNGGLSMMGQGTSQEKAVLDVNLAAAKQIARELRLRDIGGIIVVDFIDMADEAHKRLVYEEMKRAVEKDRSMVKVSELSRHGLMEITRKRVRPSVSFLISEPCSCCHATGRVEALETSFSKIEHEICRMVAASDQKADPDNAKSWPRFILKVDRYMCNYLTSGKRTKLAILSSSLKVWILLKVARGFPRGAFEVKPFVDGKSNDDERPVMISRLHSAEARSYIPNSKLTVFPVKKWKAHGK